MFRACLDYFLLSSVYGLTHLLGTKHLFSHYFIRSRAEMWIINIKARLFIYSKNVVE